MGGGQFVSLETGKSGCLLQAQLDSRAQTALLGPSLFHHSAPLSSSGPSLKKTFFFFLLSYIAIFDCAGSLLLHRGRSLVAMQELLITVASLVAEHRSCLGLRSCGAWA